MNATVNATVIAGTPVGTVIEALGWTLLHFVWQGAAVALVLWIILRLARNHKPQVRYLAGCAALALMCGAALATLVMEMQAVKQEMAGSSKRVAGTLPEVTQNSLLAGTSAPEHQAASGTFARVSTSVFESASSTATATVPASVPSAVPAAIQNAPSGFALLKSLPQAVARMGGRVEPYLPWIVCLWAVGVAFFSLRLLAGWSAVRELRVAADATDTLWIGRFNQLKTRLAVSYAVRLVFSTSAAVPMVIGWLKPVVLVPAGLVAGLSPAQLEAILAHELIHIRRHDYLVNLVQNVVETVFFYHPAVAWVSGRIRIEREHCCDDAASLACGGTLDYARALAALAELRRGPALGVAANGGSLVDRIRRLVAASQTDERRGMSSGAATLLSLTVSVVALAALGAAVAQQQAPAKRAAEPIRAANSAASPPVETKSRALTPTAEDMVTVRGQVLLPDGRPAAGARIFEQALSRTDREKQAPPATTSADPAGKFSLRIPASKTPDGQPRPVQLAALAPGYGLQWTNVGGPKGNPTEPIILKLLPEHPVHGRIVDLEGRPVRDVRVKVLQQRVGRIGGGRLPTFDDDSQPPVRTDADGRFLLAGIGGERVVLVEIRGETIAYARFTVDTRKTRSAPLRRLGPQETNRTFGPDFTFDAAPTKPVVGTVRDVDTGRPLAGVTLASNSIVGVQVYPPDVLRTVTDAQGRYRLVGLPKGSGRSRAGRNEIAALPNADQPYFMNHVDVPDTPGLAPVTLDITMKRGVFITGRVTDKVTGKPVPSNLNYFPLRTNPFAANRPEFDRGQFRTGDLGDCETRADGSFRLVGLPGGGIVTAKAQAWGARPTPQALGGLYVRGVGASAIAGINKNGDLPTYGMSFFANVKRVNALKEINPAPATQSVVCDFALDPGGTIQIHLVDGKGKPADMCRVFEGQERGSMNLSGALRESTFELTGLSPNESRNLAICQPNRKIGKVLTVRYDEKSPRSLTVTLEPCATVKGRLVDEDGVAVKGLTVWPMAHKGVDTSGLPGRQVGCDAEGRFVDDELAPGCDHYSLRVMGRDGLVSVVSDKIAVVAGKTIDLGDVKVMRRRMD